MAASLPLIRMRVPNVQFLIAAAPNLADELFEPLMVPLKPEPTDDPRRKQVAAQYPPESGGHHRSDPPSSGAD